MSFLLRTIFEEDEIRHRDSLTPEFLSRVAARATEIIAERGWASTERLHQRTEAAIMAYLDLQIESLRAKE